VASLGQPKERHDAEHQHDEWAMTPDGGDIPFDQAVSQAFLCGLVHG
jgi:hypothetical protein